MTTQLWAGVGFLARFFISSVSHTLRAARLPKDSIIFCAFFPLVFPALQLALLPAGPYFKSPAR
jgi:hypothetical protein